MRMATAPTGEVPFAATARSEWTKLRTSRGTVLTALAAALITLMLTALHCANAPAGQIDAVGASLFGITVAQFVAGVCGALAVTNEYSSATMRISLVATPPRVRLFLGKVLLLAGAALSYGILVAATAFATGWTLLGVHAHTGDPALAVRRILGAAAVLTATTLIGAGCGDPTRQRRRDHLHTRRPRSTRTDPRRPSRRRTRPPVALHTAVGRGQLSQACPVRPGSRRWPRWPLSLPRSPCCSGRPLSSSRGATRDCGSMSFDPWCCASGPAM